MSLRPALLLGGLLLGLAACGQPEVGTDELEQQVSTQLEQQVGRAPASVACDDPLPAEVDAEVRCVLTAQNGTRIGMSVVTTEVDGERVRFDIRVDDEAMD